LGLLREKKLAGSQRVVTPLSLRRESAFAACSFSWTLSIVFALLMNPEQPDQKPDDPETSARSLNEVAVGYRLFRDAAEYVFDRARQVSQAVQERVKLVLKQSGSSIPTDPRSDPDQKTPPANRSSRPQDEASH